MSFNEVKEMINKLKDIRFFNTSNSNSAIGSYDLSIIGTEVRKELVNNLVSATYDISEKLDIYAKEVNTAIMTKKETLTKSGHISNFYDTYYITPEGKFRKDKYKVNPVTKKPFEPNTREQKIMGMFSFRDNKGRELFLRPETCQQIFIGLPIFFEELKLIKNAINPDRSLEKFALFQVGKAFRQEIVNVANNQIRRQEFEIFEIENFSFKEWSDSDANKIINYWLDWTANTYEIPKEKLRIREHDKEELAFYSSKTVDIEYLTKSGEWVEIFGIAKRGNYDCTQHQVFIGRDRGEYVAPFVLEVSAGIERLMVMIEQEIKG